jgi:hypothetical protein
MTQTQYPFYSVVTFGSPTTHIGSFYRTAEAACRVADRAKGTGSCTTARVVGCSTRRAARDADISLTWCARQTVYQASPPDRYPGAPAGVPQ